MTVLGNCSASRLIAACPRCDEPLSTIQNTRSADLYGSWVMTCSTSRVNGTIPVVSSHLPLDLRAVHIVGGEVGHRAATVIVVVDPHHPGLPRWQGGVAAAPGLYRRF